VTRLVLAVALVLGVAVAGGAAAFGSSAPKPAPVPVSGAAPWPAPKNPMALTRQAGLAPEAYEHLIHHVHSHLDVFVNGKHIVVPAGIGIDTHNPRVHHSPLQDGTMAYGGIDPPCKTACISPLHTHAAYGLLHTESASATPNTLGEFFTEWNVRLDTRCVGGYCKPDSILVYVNGKPYTGDPRKIALVDHTEIAIVIGSPPKKIPSRFPLNVPI
jgi:hypothetical protein